MVPQTQQTELYEATSNLKNTVTQQLQIINLTSYALTPLERQLMFKILYHQPSMIDTLPEEDRQVFRDLLDLLKENESNEELGKFKFPYKTPSQKTPSFKLCPPIQIFFELVSKDIQDLDISKHQRDNLTKPERLALSSLSENDTFVIKEADKGGNIVLWGTEQYTQEALKQLTNTSFYQVLPSDPTDTFKKKLDLLIDAASHYGTINNNEWTAEECGSFIEELNENPWNIRLTAKISKEMVEFLDLKIKMHGPQVKTTLYRKETATNNLLHYQSFHPPHLKNGIPTGQFLRIRRNCSEEQDFKFHAKDLSERFKSRGYPQKVISKAFSKAAKSNRIQTFTPKHRIKDNKPRIITAYNSQWQDITKILNRNWNILLCEPKLIPHITERPLLTARRARNLGDRVTRSHFSRPTTRLGRGTKLIGSYACGDCNICQFVESSDTFTDPVDKKQYPLKSYINCRTKNIIYAITCSCPKVYIGQTSQELRKRIQHHLSTIRLAERDIKQNKILTSVASHFLQVHKDHIYV
ncbi:uncharacterized protein LOC142681493 [Rhinoderma darwinii]|uniref:uncharacterized protein LOC142657131 n=1 Tax=Rhinoderma darwinii TaxID=43563 RepID=UPI003F6802B8